MKILLVTLFSLALLPVFAESLKQGEYLGAKTSETPHWFKESFLEFEEDVAEANDTGKRVMLYFHQEGCPYCAKLVDENFSDPKIEKFVRKNFDGITINMWGDRELVSIGGQTYSEKKFAEALRVQYTPTLLFLNEQGKVALRLNGYYPPEKFEQALKYVAERHEKKQSFNEFLLVNQPKQTGSLIAEEFFVQQADLTLLAGKPLAIYFESANCVECKVMHDRVLTDPATKQLIHKMNNVQLDIHSDLPIKTFVGNTISQKEYAKKLNITYTPSVVLFDAQGKEVHRMEGFLKTFHFQSSLDYVLQKSYLTQPNFQRYLSSRGEKLRELGYDTDIWGYESAYPVGTVKNANTD